MRIAIVTETFLPSVDGVVTRLTHAVEHLTARGHEVLVLAPDLGVREHSGARVIGIPAVTLPFYRDRPFSLPHRAVDRALREFRPDIVHAAQPILLASSAARAAHRRGVPLVASYHTHVPRYLDLYRGTRWARPLLWWWIRRNHGLADLNLVTSAAMRDELAAHGIPRLRVLRRGVDTEARNPRFRSAAMRERLLGGAVDGMGTGGREPAVLLYVGRLAAEKSIDTLRPLLDRRADVRLAIVGDGPDRTRLEQVFAGTGTVFTGFLRGDELAAAFASADAFIFPSVTETLGLVILEAMASGLPVVAARSGPTVEQVEDGVTGRLYESGDVASMERAVRGVVGDEVGDAAGVGDDLRPEPEPEPEPGSGPGGGLGGGDGDGDGDGGVDRDGGNAAPGADVGRAARVEALRFSWDAAGDDLLDCYGQAIAVHRVRRDR